MHPDRNHSLRAALSGLTPCASARTTAQRSQAGCAQSCGLRAVVRIGSSSSRARGSEGWNQRPTEIAAPRPRWRKDQRRRSCCSRRFCRWLSESEQLSPAVLFVLARIHLDHYALGCVTTPKRCCPTSVAPILLTRCTRRCSERRSNALSTSARKRRPSDRCA